MPVWPVSATRATSSSSGVKLSRSCRCILNTCKNSRVAASCHMPRTCCSCCACSSAESWRSITATSKGCLTCCLTTCCVKSLFRWDQNAVVHDCGRKRSRGCMRLYAKCSSKMCNVTQVMLQAKASCLQSTCELSLLTKGLALLFLCIRLLSGHS